MKSMKCLYALLFFLIFLEGSSAMKILAYFPANARSHHHVFQPVIHALAKRGHQITYVSPVPLAERTSNVLHVQYPDDAFGKQFFDTLKNYPFFLPTSLRTVYIFGQVSVLFTKTFCDSKVIQELVNSNNSYDVVLHSAFLSQEHAFPLIHRFKSLGVAFIPISDVAWVNELSGLTNNPSYMMDFQTTSVADRMNFYERLTTTAHLVSSLLANYYYLYQTQKLMDKCFTYDGWESRPSLYKLAKDQALYLSVSHHAVGYAYPRAPHVKEVAGIHIVSPKPLPENLQEFISHTDCENGFIYFSLGSFLPTESGEFSRLKTVFLNIFRLRKEKVLFKWNVDDSSSISDNIFMSKWFPQQDVLAHRCIKLFVTHSGFQSTIETIHYGVPVVSIPMFSDQYKNARLAEYSGFGLTIDLKNITENSAAWAVNEVLSNPKYREEAKRRSKLLRDRPLKPLDEAVYWIEYVHKYGRALQPASVHLSFIQSHMLDIYALISVTFVACILIVRKLNKLCGRGLLVNRESNQPREGQ